MQLGRGPAQGTGLLRESVEALFFHAETQRRNWLELLYCLAALRGIEPEVKRIMLFVFTQRRKDAIIKLSLMLCSPDDLILQFGA